MTTVADHDAYIAAAPDPFRPSLELLRSLLARALPEAKEVVAYGMPGFGIGGSVVASYAAFSKQCGLYVRPEAISEHADEITALGLKATKTGITFSPRRPIPDDLVDRLARTSREYATPPRPRRDSFDPGENRARLDRLRDLVHRLSEHDLRSRLPNGWTVAVSLAHLAFWDRQRLALLNHWQAAGFDPCVYPPDVFNEALTPFLEAIPVELVGRFALEAAETVSDAISALPAPFLTAVRDQPDPPNLARWEHWEHHVEQIEKALADRRAG